MEEENNLLEAQITGLSANSQVGVGASLRRTSPPCHPFNETNQTPVGDKGKRVNDDEPDIPMNDTSDKRQDDTVSKCETHATSHEAHHLTQKAAGKTHQTVHHADDGHTSEVTMLHKEIDELKKTIFQITGL